MIKTPDEIKQISFRIILHAGNARSLAMEGISLSKRYQFEQAENKISEADKEFSLAHQAQTHLLQAEAKGMKYEVPIILVHAQDHLMTAMTVKDLAVEMIEMYQKMSQLEAGCK